MDISIICPCYNLEGYIKPLLYSLHMINFKDIDYEILFVIEEDCQDKTEDIIKEFMSDMNYHIYKSNQHCNGAARNVGMENATGEYIWFVDGDDWIIYPDVIQQSLKILKDYDIPIVQLKFVSNFFNAEHYSMVWQYIFKYDFIKDIKFWNQKLFEDNDFMKQVLTKYGSINLLKLNIPCYFYNYERPGSNMYKYRHGEITQ